MKSYLLKGLTDEQLGLLASAGVNIYEWEEGILIEETQLELVLATLGATGTKSDTDYEGVYRLKLKFSKRTKGKKKSGKNEKNEPENIDDEEARKREEIRQESRRRYIKACSSRTKAMLDDARASAKASRKKLTGMKQRFVKTKREEIFAGKFDSNGTAAQNILAELERVRMITGVRAVHVVPNRILIATEILCATDPETGFRYEVGQFLITVYLDGSNDGIRWQNNSRRIKGVREQMHAPTVHSNGQAAAAEIHSTILELIARLELSTVVELAIQVVESPEKNEYGKTVSRWPML